MLEKVKAPDLLDRDFKATILNFLRGKGKYRHTNVGHCEKDIGTKRQYQQRSINYLKKTNRNSGAEKFNN